jgi:hypothetical protein
MRYEKHNIVLHVGSRVIFSKGELLGTHLFGRWYVQRLFNVFLESVWSDHLLFEMLTMMFWRGASHSDICFGLAYLVVGHTGGAKVLYF